MTRRFCDVAVNLTDCVFRGIDWKGRRVHVDDFDQVLLRAKAQQVNPILVTGTSLEQSIRAVELCRLYPEVLKCTVGVHPAHAAEFLLPLQTVNERNLACSQGLPAVVTVEGPTAPTASPDEWDDLLAAHAPARLRLLSDLIQQNTQFVVAVGEFGLDGAEVATAPMALQAKVMALQWAHFLEYHSGLPLLLHSRDCGMAVVDFLTTQEGNNNNMAAVSTTAQRKAVVHSFTGSLEELKAYLQWGYFISLNGAAFRDQSKAEEIFSALPLNRLLLETDAPWCDIRPEHYGYQFLRTVFPTVKRGKEPRVVVAAPSSKTDGKKGSRSGGDTQPVKEEVAESGVEWKCVDRRQEPCHMVQVVEVFVGAYNAWLERERPTEAPLTVDGAAEIVYRNSLAVFLS